MRSGREHWRGWSWLRSGRERCGSRIAVGRGGRGEDEEEAGGTRKAGGVEEEEEEERKEATLIKSNNPHLAGGEKTQTRDFYVFDMWKTGFS